MISSSVTIRRRLSFSAVPDVVLEDTGLSFAARIALGWMLGRPNGWEVRIGHMTKVLGLTGRTWPRVKRELSQRGFFLQKRLKTAAGKFEWRHEITDAPLLSSIPTVCRDGECIGDERTDAKRGNKAAGGHQEDMKQQQTSQRIVSPTTGSVGDDYEKRKSPRRHPGGIECWYPAEDKEAHELLAKFPVDEIAAAVCAIHNRLNRLGNPTSPVPTLVKREIRSARRHSKEEIENAKLAKQCEIKPPLAREAGYERARVARLALQAMTAS